MRFSCEKRASRCKRPRSSPSSVGSLETPRAAPNIQARLVRCSRSLIWRSNSRCGIGGLDRAGEACAQPCHVVQNFIESIEAIVPLEHNRCRRLPFERIVEEIERRIWYRMGMGILEERARQELLVQGDAAGDVHLLDHMSGQIVEERIGIKAVIASVEI